MNTDARGRGAEEQHAGTPMTLVEAAKHIQRFKQDTLRRRIAALERDFHGADQAACAALAPAAGIGPELWVSAQYMKREAAQIDVVVHSTGILLALSYILQEGEVVEALSLGAGNTGVPFDLITNRRVAEFKFTRWSGKRDVVRQNQFFKDFYLLAEEETPKDRYLYVTGDQYPLAFLRGGRALKSVLHSNKLLSGFQTRYGERFVTVGEYYAYRQAAVTIVDLAKVVPYFARAMRTEEASDSEEDVEA